MWHILFNNRVIFSLLGHCGMSISKFKWNGLTIWRKYQIWVTVLQNRFILIAILESIKGSTHEDQLCREEEILSQEPRNCSLSRAKTVLGCDVRKVIQTGWYWPEVEESLSSGIIYWKNCQMNFHYSFNRVELTTASVITSENNLWSLL